MTTETGKPGWMLDELSSVGRENLDAVHVSRYDDKEDADAAAELRYLQSAGLTSDSVVIDLGAGTGQFALVAADACRRVVAVDPSPVMLEVLREKARRRSSPLEVVQAGFLTYDHSGDTPDFVYSRFALHHLPDFWKAIALRRMHGMLRHGGFLRLSDVVFHFPIEEAEDRIEQWCAADHGIWTREEAEEHVRDEHSTFTWLLEPMSEGAGFAVRDARYSEDGFLAQYLLAAT